MAEQDGHAMDNADPLVAEHNFQYPFSLNHMHSKIYIFIINKKCIVKFIIEQEHLVPFTSIVVYLGVII